MCGELEYVSNHNPASPNYSWFQRRFVNVFHMWLYWSNWKCSKFQFSRSVMVDLPLQLMKGQFCLLVYLTPVRPLAADRELGLCETLLLGWPASVQNDRDGNCGNVLLRLKSRTHERQSQFFQWTHWHLEISLCEPILYSQSNIWSLLTTRAPRISNKIMWGIGSQT